METKSGKIKPQSIDGSKGRVLNCIDSPDQEDDWGFQDALSAGLLGTQKISTPLKMDLRERWWSIDDQKQTGACVGFAAAYGLLRWLYVSKGIMARNTKPSARFIWMANKETDELISYPSTFIETEGTQTKHALRIARKYGCVSDQTLPMSGKLSKLSAKDFYAKASKYRINSYHNLGKNINNWKTWLVNNGPILTRLNVDKTWSDATTTRGILDSYLPNTVKGGHAVCIVGYTPEYFIIRNSWGRSWGDRGFAYSSYEYTRSAFTEAYGAVI